MRKISSLLLLFPIVLFSISCNEDKGNYDYTAIPDIEITDIETSYDVYKLEDFRLSPTVKTVFSESDLEYIWTAYGDKIEFIDTIAYTKEVIFVPTNDNTTLALTVKNRNTGTGAVATTSLRASTEFARGFYLLKETVDGNTDMDFHTADLSLNDLIEKSTGEPLAGVPNRLAYLMQYYHLDPDDASLVDGANCLMPMSENDLKIFRVEDMKLIYDHDSFFIGGEAPEDGSPLYAAVGFGGLSYFASYGYYSNLMGMWGNTSTGRVGFPENTEDIIKPSRYACMFVMGGMMDEHLFFDEGDRSFKTSGWSGGITHYTGSWNANDDRRPVNISADRELIYLGSKLNGNCYAVFQNTGNNTIKYLYNMTPELSDPITEVITISSGPLSDSPVYAALFTTGEYLFAIGDNNELIYFNMEDQSSNAVTLNGLPADEEVTYMANKYWGNTSDAGNTFNYLVVATHKDGNYKVYVYDIIGIIPSGNPVNIFEGEGIIKDCQCTSPITSGFWGPAFDSYNFN